MFGQTSREPAEFNEAAGNCLLEKSQGERREVCLMRGTVQIFGRVCALHAPMKRMADPRTPIACFELICILSFQPGFSYGASVSRQDDILQPGEHPHTVLHLLFQSSFIRY
jgi:hypothetical protein